MRHIKSPLAIVLLAMILYCEDAPSQPLKLTSSLDLPGHELDLWMHTDTLGTEYVLIGTDTAMHIVNVSTPENPLLVSTVYIPFENSWGAFDIKVYQNYAYIVTGSATDTGLIYDISNPINPVRAGKFPDSHNIFISEDGYLIAEGPKMKIYDLNQDPTNPVLIYSTSDDLGHDAAVIGDRLIDFHSNQTNIYSTSNMHNPILLGYIPNTVYGFSHSGWVTDDGNYLLISCERCPSLKQLTMWDIRDYENMFLTSNYNDTSTSIHNVQTRGSYAFVSYYERGLRVFKISDPYNIRMVAEYDPVPGANTNFSGTFGVYAFSSSGYIFTSDSYEGLMVFEFDSSQVSIEQISSEIPGGYQLHQNYPNPFNPETKIKFEIPLSVRSQRSEVRLTIHDITGREVSVLFNGALAPGVYEYSFDGEGLGSGVYFYRLESNGYMETRKMILLK